MKKEYPYNLFDAIVQRTVFKGNMPESVTQDMMAGLQYALSVLRAKEQVVLKLRYEEGKTLKQIGEVFSVTGSRVRQIEERAFRRLKRPEVWRFVEHGILGVIDMEMKNTYEDAYKDGFDVGYMAGIKDYSQSILEKTSAQVGQELSIDQLGLSTRAYNCLQLCGCKTIGDVAQMKHDQICRIRNFGVKSRLEVRRVLHYYNIYNTDWEMQSAGDGRV